MTIPLNDLRARTAGRVLEPSDADFLGAVTGFNLSATYAPDAAVAVANESDVVEAVNFARKNGLKVAIQATGHGASGVMTGGLLILTAALDTVTIDGDIATIGAGAPWSSVVALADAAGLTAITGSAPAVGAVGYLLGGGLGPIARSHGFSSDYVRSFRVVTGGGHLVTASATYNPELFWALRGGKAGFGVVTSVDVQLVPLSEIYGGSLMFATEDIDAVFRGWIEWTATAGPDVSTSAAIMRFPPIEQVPEPLRGKTLLALRFAYPGAGGEALASPLRALAPAMMDTLGTMPTSAMGTIHNDPTAPSASWVAGAMLTHVDQDFSSVLLDAVGADIRSPFVAVELRHLGNRTAVDVDGKRSGDGSSVGGRDAAFALAIIAVPNPHAPVPVIVAAWQQLALGIEPWKSPVTTINFAGEPSAETLKDSWSAEIFARLQQVAAVYDPAALFSWRPNAG
jgi:hypothetical protein